MRVSNLDEQEYHADPALSVSGAKKLLPPSTPAAFKWERDNPPEPSPAMLFGTLAHRLLLEDGRDVTVVEAASWTGKAAQEAKAAAKAEGLLPVLRKDYDKAVAMRDAAQQQLDGTDILGPGEAEVSLFRTDPDTGVKLRGRLDWLNHKPGDDGVLIVPDYKTTASADPKQFAKSVATYGYHMQAAWYTDLILAEGLAERVRFVFIAQEKEPPYLLSLIALDDFALRLGRAKNRRAIDVFADCERFGFWPGYDNNVQTVELPGWAQYEADEYLLP